MARVFRRQKQPAEETGDSSGQDVLVHGGILADIKVHIDAKGGPVIFTYKILRLLGCLGLVGMTIATLVIDENGRQTSFLEALKRKKKKKKKNASSDAFTEAEWLQVALCLTYVCVILSMVRIAEQDTEPFADLCFLPGPGLCRSQAPLVSNGKHAPCFSPALYMGNFHVS